MSVYMFFMFGWLDFTSFSTILAISGCPCHIILEWGVPVLPLIIKVECLTAMKLIVNHCWDLARVQKPQPPSPKANTQFILAKFSYPLYHLGYNMCEI